MTTTVVLSNMPSSASDVSVKLLDQSKLVLEKTVIGTDGSIVATFVYADGDPTTPTTVVARIASSAKTGLTYNSITLETIQIVTVDSIVTETQPLSVTIGWNTPGIMEDAGSVLDMIGTGFSLCFNGVTSKVPNEGIIDKMNRSLVAALF
jgi:hypothetical protein